MPTKREREYYAMGYRDGIRSQVMKIDQRRFVDTDLYDYTLEGATCPKRSTAPRKRKLSAWQKYIKNKRNHIKYRDGKLNLKKMGVAFRRKKRR